MQIPRQHCQVKGHLIPHNPQLLTSDVTSIQRFMQHSFLIFGGYSPWLQIQGLFQHPVGRWFIDSFLSQLEDVGETVDDEALVTLWSSPVWCMWLPASAIRISISWPRMIGKRKQQLASSIIFWCTRHNRPGSFDCYIVRRGSLHVHIIRKSSCFPYSGNL